MTKVNRPDDFASIFREINRRLEALERAPRATHTSVREGSFTVVDDQGRTRVQLGKLPWGTYGIRTLLVTGSGNEESIWADERGLISPYLATPWADRFAYRAATTSTFDYAWSTIVEVLVAPGVRVRVPWLTDAGTTGELRLRHPGSGAVTSTVSLAAGAEGWQVFTWLHGQTLGTGPHTFEVQARRTTGTGEVRIYEPHALHQVGALGSSTGL